MTCIAYFVHNLADAAVGRRITMFRAAGADVRVLGFCRDAVPPAEVAGAPAISLGQTFDADLRQRAMMVARNLARPGRLQAAAQGCDVIVARNLEVMLLAAATQRRAGVPRLVYESLDIHRSLLGSGAVGKVMRTIERSAMRRADLLIYSSPAFWRDYFEPVQHAKLQRVLVENKLLALEGAVRPLDGPSAGPPWRIGWFGNLRCRRTLAELRGLADAGAGRIEVLIAGKASPAEFPDFAAAVAHPHITFAGPYRAADLPALYARVHFAWAIDWFEEGLNSTWLLPNRLYEAAASGAVPIALADVETGRWLRAHHAGLLVDGDAGVAGLGDRLAHLSPTDFAGLRESVAAIPREALIATEADCTDLLRAIAG